MDIGARQRVDIEMGVGAVAESISVTGAAPLLETDSSQRGQVITGEQTRPALNDREYSGTGPAERRRPPVGLQQAARTRRVKARSTSTACAARSTTSSSTASTTTPTAPATRASNQVMQPPPDAVGEFKVVTNNSSAEYGRAAGATINVVCRSGTNSLHGGLEFVRDTSMNATGFFAANWRPRCTATSSACSAVHSPGTAFFFGDYEGYRQTRKVTGISTIPTAANISGILPVAIRDPRTGITYDVGTPIPMTAFARKVLSALPAPTSTGTANNYTILQNFTNNTDKAGGKVDVQLAQDSRRLDATDGVT